jgi:uncharacterized protein YggU (UPF0235/DUF167 family)
VAPIAAATIIEQVMDPDFRFDDRSRRAEVRFAVRLTPRGGVDRVDGVNDEGVLQARVSAPPVGGAANTALIRLLADELDVARSSVRLVAGAAGRHKLVVVEGISAAGINARWPGLKL